jgi:predicted kinase
MIVNNFLQQVLDGATPDIDEFVAVLGERIPLLKEYKLTPQDREWHAEGDVHIHVGMVLEETYKILAEASSLSKNNRLSLILGALLHDIAKPITTREEEIQGIIRTIAPRHASIGRSYLAPKLMSLGLDYEVVEMTMGLVGYHHEPKQLVIKEKSRGDYQKIARLANPELLYWLELADIRGRKCRDKQQQIDYIEMYGLFAREYQAWQRYGSEYQKWRDYFNEKLENWNQDTKDLVLGNALKNWEAGKILFPEEELARSYNYRNSFPQVVLTFGLSGSGKSTWIKQNLPEHEIISLDDLRVEIAGDRKNQIENSKVVAIARERLKIQLRSHQKVVWDATNLRRDFRQQIINLSLNYGALITLVIFHCEESVYFERNQQRSHPIPEAVLKRQLEIMEFPELDEAHRVIIVEEKGNILASYGNC